VHAVLAFCRWSLFAVLVVAAAIAMVENRAPVSLEFLGYHSAELPLYWWLVIAFAGGGLCGWLISGVGAIRARADARRARAALTQATRADG
jgi:uncharacterized integral membrane protein